MPAPTNLNEVRAADVRLAATVSDLDDAGFAQASGLPDWSRAHVIAHLALNAEGLAGVLDSMTAGSIRPMYPSQDQRNADIAALAGASPAEVRRRFADSLGRFTSAAEAVPAEAWAGVFPRVPDGPQVDRAAIVDMRLFEVEVHHADLAAGYSAVDWSDEFVTTVLRAAVRDRADVPGFVLRTPQGEVAVGRLPDEGAGPVVSGAGRDAAWWLLGRGRGEGLTGEPELPVLGAWR